MFKTTISGFNGIQQQFLSASKELTAIVDQELESMAKEWVAGAKRDAPVDQGTLKAGISYYGNSTNGNPGYSIVSNAFYSPFMEFGTKGKYLPIPGTEAIAEQFRGFKSGNIMDMLRMIVRWVKRKGIAGVYSVKTKKRVGNKINRLAEDYAAAWPILMSILKYGVTPHPFFFKQQELVWPAMVRNVKRRIEQDQKVSVILPGDIFRPNIITI